MAVLKEKESNASATVDAWMTQMRAAGIQGYFLYAEGTVNGELVRRMDWKMSTTAAMSGNTSGAGDLGQGARNIGGTSYNGAEILIKTYTLTGDVAGNLIYTASGNASQFTSRMMELASWKY